MLANAGRRGIVCELPADANESPEDKIKREDETKRRKRLHYYLLARGRETQGKLGEAFDHYLALANLGEGKQLIEMPNEPNVKMRPDVWARGRIETMIRSATTAEAKKSLEDRVNKEWNAVKDANDLKKLREFVAVFGPFFESGREAQFKLGLYRINKRVRERRFPLVDEERGIVVATGFFDHANAFDEYKLTNGRTMKTALKWPNSITLMEAFRVRDGRIHRIEAIFTYVPYFMHNPWAVRR